MKSLTQIHQSIKNFFQNKVKDTIERGSVIDLFMLSTANEISDAYDYIESNKNPHIYTKLSGQNLDDMVKMCGFQRREGESDQNLLYRLLNWTLINEKSNTVAIDAALLNLKNASNVTYVPMVYGTGTAICYVIPTEYTVEKIEQALEEAKDRLKNVISPSLYIEYVTPALKAVTLSIAINNENSNLADIKKNLEKKIADYINSIPPKEFLDIGHINKIGINETGVSYFNINGLFVDGVSVTSLKTLQDIKSKMLLDVINWIEV